MSTAERPDVTALRAAMPGTPRTTTPLNETDISWTHYTWNPVHGCSKVSPGCRNCYAERISLTYNHTEKPWTHENAAENVHVRSGAMDDPYGHVRHDPVSAVFAPSMGDLFHEEVSRDAVRTVFGVMRNTPTILYQTLTKRPERAASWPRFPPNTWVGTSVENAAQKHRIDAIREANAPLRFVSFEPLIGRIGDVDLSGIEWIIIGGESEPDDDQRREMDHEWAVELVEQAREAGCDVWFKQSSGEKSETGTELVDTSDGYPVTREIRERPAPPDAVRNAREALRERAQR